SDRKAKESLERVDHIRSSFVSHDLGYDMNDIERFDLVLDTGVVSTAEASATIVAAYRHLLINHRVNARKTRADLVVDEVLQRLVANIVTEKRKTKS
ncbi:MAG: cytidylate kinase-like family protein, partial [Sphaerochaeta sp.]